MITVSFQLNLGKESRSDDAKESEDEKKMEMLRGISYEDDDTSELRNSKTTMEANERRQNVTQKAVRKIQLWWRIVSAIKHKKRGQKEELTNESKIEEHVTKYASDLRCTPCGKRFDTREGLHKHILQDVRHDQSVINYDKFMQYKKSIVDHWWKTAEELLDREVQGQPIAGQDISQELIKAIADVSMSMTFIEKASQWSDMSSLNESVVNLQNAYWKLEEQVCKLDGMQLVYTILLSFPNPHLRWRTIKLNVLCIPSITKKGFISNLKLLTKVLIICENPDRYIPIH